MVVQEKVRLQFTLGVNLKDHGPGTQIEVTLNSVLQCGGSFMKYSFTEQRHK